MNYRLVAIVLSAVYLSSSVSASRLSHSYLPPSSPDTSDYPIAIASDISIISGEQLIDAEPKNSSGNDDGLIVRNDRDDSAFNGLFGNIGNIFDGEHQILVSPCTSSPRTEFVTDTITNTMSFLDTSFITVHFQTTDTQVASFYTTITTTKTFDNEISYTHRVTDYTTQTATQTQIVRLPATTYFETQFVTSTRTTLVTETSTVTNIHRLQLTNYVTSTSFATTIVQSTIPVTETAFFTVQPSVRTSRVVDVISVTKTSVVPPFTDIAYSTKFITTTEVQVQNVAAPTTTQIQTVIIPDVRFITQTSYDTKFETSYIPNHIDTTTSDISYVTTTYFQRSANTKVETKVHSRTSTVLKEVTRTQYADSVSTITIPRISYHTFTNTVTKTSTLVQTIETFHTTSIVEYQSQYSTVYETLAPATRVNSVIVTPTCTAQTGYQYSVPSVAYNPFAFRG